MVDRREAAADFLAKLRLRRDGMAPPVSDLPEEIRPRNEAEAYAVQAVLREKLGPALGPVMGWKIGCTTAVMQAYLGIDHPCLGSLYQSQHHEERVTLEAARYRRLGLECELGVRLGAPLRPGEDAAAAVSEVMCSVEIVEERFTDFNACAPQSLVADDFFSAGSVFGKGVPLSALHDLSAVSGGFEINGVRAAQGRGEAILGDPLRALAFAAERCGAEGGLKAGEIVTLGSVVKTIYPDPGMTVIAHFEGMAPVEISVV